MAMRFNDMDAGRGRFNRRFAEEKKPEGSATIGDVFKDKMDAVRAEDERKKQKPLRDLTGKMRGEGIDVDIEFDRAKATLVFRASGDHQAYMRDYFNSSQSTARGAGFMLAARMKNASAPKPR